MNPHANPNSTAADPTEPLGLTSGAFVDRYARARFWEISRQGAEQGRGAGGRRGALEAYKSLFRTGDTSPIVRVEPGFAVPGIKTVLKEPCEEGELTKFTQGVAGAGTEAGTPTGRVFEELSTESVLIPMVGKTGRPTFTLCVSSQIGCAMGCTFCETAQMGLIRSLTPGEIVAQWFAATHLLGKKPSNIVFMGMGEPMDNLDSVLAAVSVLKDHNGVSLPISKITISTVGRVDGIARLGEKLHEPGWHRLNLALSLNAPSDAVRSQIMPVNRKWNMATLRESLLAFPIYGGGKLCVEYVLIPDVNDSREHANEVADFLEPINEHYRRAKGAGGTSVVGEEQRQGSPRVMLNLIPYNPRRNSPWPAPSEESVEAFMAWLMERGVFVKRRRTKGRDLMGACGQLGSQEIRGRKLVQVGVSPPPHRTPAG